MPDIPPFHRTKRWAVTLAATVASTYVLDLVATAAGVALAASHLLRGVDHWLIVASGPRS